LKAPSKNVAGSLRKQRAPGRTAEPITVTTVSKKPTLTVPGEGGVASPPGALLVGDERQSRSAANFADAMAPFGGPKSA
jgi:hypothetical protein